MSEQIPSFEMCWFCGKNADDVRTRAIFGLHKNHKIDYMVFWLRHRWNELNLGVPRCAVCFALHRKAKRTGNLIGWVLVIAFLLLGILGMTIISDFLNSEKLSFLPSLCFLLPFGGYFLGRWIGQDIIHSSVPEVKPIKYGHTYPTIDLRLKEGWKAGIPLE
jgi:hypothetical protein